MEGTDMTDHKVAASELGLGDVVSLNFADRVYDVGTVTEIDGTGWVTITRPYVHVGDAIIGNGSRGGPGHLLSYIGLEAFKVGGGDERKVFTVLRKGDPEAQFRAAEREREQFQHEIARLAALIESQHADLKQRGELLTVVETARKSAEQSLANVKEDLRRERERADKVHRLVAEASATLHGAVVGQ